MCNIYCLDNQMKMNRKGNYFILNTLKLVGQKSKKIGASLLLENPLVSDLLSFNALSSLTLLDEYAN